MRCTLSDRDVSFISQTIYRINQLNDYESTCNVLFEQLQLLIPFDKAIIFKLVERDGILTYNSPIAYNTSEESFDENIFMHGNYRPDWLTYTRAPWTSTFRQTDIRQEDEFVKTKLYNDIYAPQDIYYALHSILVHDDHKLAQLGLFRSQQKQDFSDRDIFILSTFALHIELKFFNLSPQFSSSRMCQNMFAVDDFKFHLMQKYGITQREAEVLLLLQNGEENQKIANALFISKSTLDKHLNSLYRKMNVKKRTQLVSLLFDEREGFSLPNNLLFKCPQQV